jgi:hypothetical protein
LAYACRHFDAAIVSSTLIADGFSLFRHLRARCLLLPFAFSG